MEENKENVGMNKSTGAKKVENIEEGLERAKYDSRTAFAAFADGEYKRDNNNGHARARRDRSTSGWIAAVTTLGVVSLAALSVIAVGAVNMGNALSRLAGGYESEFLEVVELSERLDTDLDKLRAATGKEEQRTLLTRVLVASELMEASLERIPVDYATTTDMTAFVNRTSAFAKDELAALSRGKELSLRSIEREYAVNERLLEELETLRVSMTAKDWNDLAAKGDKEFIPKFKNLSESTKTEEEGENGPFSGNVKGNAAGSNDKAQIPPEKALERVKEYFRDYDIKSAEYKGNTAANGGTFYNFTLKDERGRALYAQTTRSGELVMFNSFEKCSANNFALKECLSIADKFLSGLGYEDMTAVWVQENGTTANINYVPTVGETLVYSDMVRLKVCETRGVVTGFEGIAYIQNHKERSIPTPVIDEATAKKNLSIAPKTCRLALIPLEEEEVLCYEFTGEKNGHEYFAYVDASSGEVVKTYVVSNTKHGRVLA